MMDHATKPRHWVFLRGLTREARHWGSFKEVFAAQFPNDILHLPDLPGAGVHNEEASPSTLEEITHRVRQRVEQEIPSGEPVYLLAISLGGMVGTEWIHQCHERIAGAVFINTSSKNLSPFYDRLRGPALVCFPLLALVPDVAIREKVILRMTSNDPLRREAAYSSWVEIQRTRRISVPTFLSQMIAAARYHTPEITAEFPFLLVASRHDRVVSPRCSEALQAHFEADLIYHPTAGHDIALDDPVWLARSIHDWFDMRTGGRS